MGSRSGGPGWEKEEMWVKQENETGSEPML